jgi:hypothetical protein
LSEFRLPKSFKKHVFTGFAAYGFIYREFAQAARDAAVDFAGPIIPSGITVTDDEIIFRCLDSVEFISINPEKIEESLIEVTRYRPVINLLYARSTGKYKKTPVTIYNTYGKLISINSTYIDSAYRFINIQGLLRQFMAMYQYSLLIGASEKISNTYLAYYNSLLYMIKTLPYKKDNVTNPSVITYGSDNISVGQTIHLARMYTERDGVEMPAVPTNYYPERAKGRPHPVVNIESMEFFLVDGRIIK